VAPVTPEKLDTLAKLGLVEAPRAAPPPARPAAPAPAPAPPAVPAPAVVAPKAAAPAAKKRPSAPDDDLVIDFDDDLVEPAVAIPAPVAAPAAAPRGRPARVASPDMIDEIAFYLDQGMAEDARKKIAALRTLGFSGADLDDLERRAAGGSEAAPAGPFEDLTLDDSDLSSITATLESELGDAPLAAATPAPEVEQSINEVFDDFKRHVNEEVGAEDYRTHYDLGIAYKEMGLVDDAIEEFRVAAQAPELFRDACSMLAMCHRARGDFDEAALWYRRTLAAPGDGTEPLTGIRYDLAEVLFEQGDYKGALELFQQVMRADPSYREVRRQVSDLEARLRT
jgi:tetratricopeptide (TPR) repeat protein